MAAATLRPPRPRAAAGPGHHRDHGHHAGRHRHSPPPPPSMRWACDRPGTAPPAPRRWPSMSAIFADLARPDPACPMPACPSCAAATPTIPSHRTSWPAGSSASSPRTASISSAAAAAPRPSTSPRSTPCCVEDRRTACPRAPDPAAAAHALARLLFSAVPLRQENAFLAIGERCNANGSKKFRELQAAATGTAASPWAASRCARAATRSTSARPSSAATRWPR